MLTEAILRQLRTLALASPRRHRGSTTGERRGIKRGRSVEFADYRNYTPGDDPRRVDWNVYARLEKPVIKLYEDEEELAVHLLLDQSASMMFHPDGADPHAASHVSAKFARAAELMTALAYVALASGDKVTLQTSTGAQFGPKRGIAQFAELAAFMDRVSAAQPNPRLALNGWLKSYATRARPGLCILASDMFEEFSASDGGAGFNALGAAGLDLNVLHILSPDELDPALAGDLRLKDVETGGMQDISLDEIVLGQYRERLEAWSAGIASQCRKRGGRYHRTDISHPAEQIILRDLRKEGWLF